MFVPDIAYSIRFIENSKIPQFEIVALFFFVIYLIKMLSSLRKIGLRWQNVNDWEIWLANEWVSGSDVNERIVEMLIE